MKGITGTMDIVKGRHEFHTWERKRCIRVEFIIKPCRHDGAIEQAKVKTQWFESHPFIPVGPEQSKRTFTKFPGNIMEELDEAHGRNPQYSGRDYVFLAHNISVELRCLYGEWRCLNTSRQSS